MVHRSGVWRRVDVVHRKNLHQLRPRRPPPRTDGIEPDRLSFPFTAWGLFYIVADAAAGNTRWRYRQQSAWPVPEQTTPSYSDAFCSNSNRHTIRWVDSYQVTGWTNGQLGELRVYDYPLGATELAAVCDTLIAKWAV